MQYKILNSVGSVVDTLEVDEADTALAQFAARIEVPSAKLVEIGYRAVPVLPEPRPDYDSPSYNDQTFAATYRLQHYLPHVHTNEYRWVNVSGETHDLPTLHQYVKTSQNPKLWRIVQTTQSVVPAPGYTDQDGFFRREY